MSLLFNLIFSPFIQAVLNLLLRSLLWADTVGNQNMEDALFPSREAELLGIPERGRKKHSRHTGARL